MTGPDHALQQIHSRISQHTSSNPSDSRRKQITETDHLNDCMVTKHLPNQLDLADR